MSIKATAPEFVECFEHFEFGEVVNEECCRF